MSLYRSISNGGNVSYNTINVNSVTGSLEGTSSYALQAMSASYALTASYILISGSIINPNTFATTGSNIFIGNQTITGSIFLNSGLLYGTASYATSAISSSYPISLSGSTLYSVSPNTSNFNTTNSIFLGASAGFGAINAFKSIFLGYGAGQVGVNAFNSIFLGENAGAGSQNSFNSNFLGQYAGLNSLNSNNSNFFGYQAGSGVFNSSYSNFIGSNTGYQAINARYSTFIGDNTGFKSSNASYSTLIGHDVARNVSGSGIGSNNIIIGTNITLENNRKDSINLGGIIFATGSYNITSSDPYSGSVSNGRVGINVINPQFTLDVSGSNHIVGTSTLTGSFLVTGSTTQIGNTLLSGSVIISGSNPPGSITASVQIYGDIRQSGYHRFDPVTTNIDTSVSSSYIYVSGSTQDLYFSQNGSGYNNVTRLRWLEGNLYTGLLHGGFITTQSSTVYQVSSGSGIIVNLNASIPNDPYPVVQYLNWPNLSASIAPLSASYDQQFIAINSSAQIFAQGIPYNDGDYNTKIPIGIVLHQNHSTINAVQTFPGVAYGWKQRSFDFIKAFGPLKISGYTLQASSSLGLLLDGGISWVDGRNYIVDPSNPSYITEATGIATSKIYYYHQSGSEFVYNTNNGAGYANVTSSLYSNNGVLTALSTNNKWSIQRVYYFPNSATKALYIYFGNVEYDNYDAALTGIQNEAFLEAPNTFANAIFVGYMLLQKTANFTTTPGPTGTWEFRSAGLFRGISGGSGGSGGGGGGGATTLAGLTDVQITSPTNGQALVYNTSTTKWINSSTITASLQGTASWAENVLTASYCIVTGSVSASVNVGTGDIFTVKSGSETYLSISSSGNGIINKQWLITNGGKLTIGSSSPGLQPLLEIKNTASPGGFWSLNVSESGDFAIRDNTNTPVTAMYIKSGSGNVGIGTTSPAYKLDVSGESRISEILRLERAGISGIDIINITDSYRWSVRTDKNNNTSNVFSIGKFTGGNTVPFQIYETGNIVLQGNKGNFNLDNGYQVYISGSGISGSLNVNNVLYVSSSNVGVGLLNPQTVLDVTSSFRVRGGSNRGQLAIYSDDAVDIGPGGGAGGALLRIYGGTSNGAASMYFGYNATYAGEIGTISPGDLYINPVSRSIFMIGGIERMRLNNNGNLLISSSTDNGYRLVISGSNTSGSLITSRPYFNNSVNDSYIIENLFENNGMNPLGTGQIYDIFSVGKNTNDGANFFRLNFNGGNSGSAFGYGTSGANSTLMQLNAPTVAALYLTAQNQGMKLYGATNTAATITTINSGNNLYLRSDVDGGNSGGGIHYYASENGVNFGHRWFLNQQEQMRLSNLGNLTIGYTGSLHPTESFYKFAVTGSSSSGSVNLNNILYVNESGVTITGSLNTTGSNTFIGDQTITGSLSITGSFNDGIRKLILTGVTDDPADTLTYNTVVNTLGDTFTFTATSGVYELTMDTTTPFTSGYTYVVFSAGLPGPGGGNVYNTPYEYIDDSTIKFYVKKNDASYGGELTQATIEIRVYIP
jgi:hypothetical protein